MSVTVDAAGVVYAAGMLGLAGDHDDGWLHSLDAEGTPRWAAQYDGAAALADTFADVAITPNGDVVVVGHEQVSRVDSPKAPSSEIVVVALGYSADGDQLWRQELAADDDYGLGDALPAVTTGVDGRIVVGATAEMDGGWPRIFFAELASDGSIVERWDHRDDGYRGLALADVQLDPDGVLHALADATTNAAQLEWLGRWDAEHAFIGSAERDHEGANPVAVLPWDGGAVVLGTVDTNSTAPVARRPMLRRYDAALELQWEHTLVLGIADTSAQPFALARDCERRLLVLAASDEQMWIFRLDADGTQLDRLDLSTSEFFAHGMGVDPAGNPVLVGDGDGGGPSRSFAVRKIAG